jgi:4-alpha-glucanotransferase
MVALSPKYLGRSATEETINDPTNPRHDWRYRIHYTLEDLLADEPLLADLQALLLGAVSGSVYLLPQGCLLTYAVLFQPVSTVRL